MDVIVPLLQGPEKHQHSTDQYRCTLAALWVFSLKERGRGKEEVRGRKGCSQVPIIWFRLLLLWLRLIELRLRGSEREEKLFVVERCARRLKEKLMERRLHCCITYTDQTRNLFGWTNSPCLLNVSRSVCYFRSLLIKTFSLTIASPLFREFCCWLRWCGTEMVADRGITAATDTSSMASKFLSRGIIGNNYLNLCRS